MIFRELKARKAKFGFDGGVINLRDVITLGKFLELLEANFADLYTAEEAGYNRPEVKIYTDDVAVDDWIRNYQFDSAPVPSKLF